MAFNVQLTTGDTVRVEADFMWVGNDGTLTLRKNPGSRERWSGAQWGRVVRAYAAGSWTTANETDDEGEE